MAVWTPHPNSIRKVRAFGVDDMATIADDVPSPAASLRLVNDGRPAPDPNSPYVLVAFLAWVSGGTGEADLELYQKIHDERSEQFNRLRRTFETFGPADESYIDCRIEADEFPHWVLGPADLWVPVWTNPDSATMQWAWEFHLAPANQ